MPVTKEQIMQKLAERKKQAQVEFKKAPVVKRPLKEARVAQRPARVVNETSLVQRGPRTITEAVQQRTAGMKPEQKHLYTVLAENISKAARVLNEATQASAGTFGAVGNGAGVGMVITFFDIFFGYFPNLIVPEIASTQPIRTEKAMIFYYQSVAGGDKGNVTAGDVLISPFRINTDVNFTSQYVDLPVVGAATSYTSGTKVLWGPFVARSLKLESATLTFSTDTAFTGVLNDNGTPIAITGGTVTLASGQVTVAMTLASAPSRTYKLNYIYDNKYAPTQVPELNANIDSREINALPRTIKTNYSFQAGFGFEAQFGVKLEDKLAEAAMYQLKREADLDFVFEIMNSAPAQVVWNKAAGVANGLYEYHKLSFRDAIVGASNHIFKISKRVRGNVLLVGPQAQTIVETLPEFVGQNFGSQIGGPSVIGKLKDIKVIAIPDLQDNDWAVIYKNDQDNLDAGIVFAPYIPVVATTPVTLDDFVIRRAYTMSYGKLVTNADYFVRGTIINDPVALPVYLVSKDGTFDVLGTLGEDAVISAVPGLPE
jgi:hypothetical protein